MGENTLAVKITADIASLQAQFATAQASTAALRKEMADLAKQSAAGVLDPAGLAQLEEASRAFLEAKANAAELAKEIKGTHEESVNLGEGLAEIRGQISTAFEVSGIAAAFEAVKSFGEAVEQLGERATQMHAMSDVLGVSTDEFQAMSAAAEEGGTSIEVFARAQEKLIGLMTQARDSSGAAAEKLLVLGLTTDQIYDPTTKINDVLGVLRERLLNSATAQETMSELARDFGAKAILAAEAIKAYDGSAAGVAATMAKLHAPNEEQIAQLHEMAVAWQELKTSATGTASQMMAAVGSAWASIQKSMGAEAGPGVSKWSEENSDKGAQQAAQAQMALDREVAQQEMENVKAGIEAYKQGSAERMAAVREYAELAAKYYGSDEIDKVKAAKTAEIAEERAYNEAQASLRAQQVRDEIKLDDGAAKARLAGIKFTIDANEQYFSDAVKVHAAIQSMEQTGLELQTQIYQQRAKLSAQSNALVQKETQDQLRQWQALTNAMQSGFATAFRGMLTGGQSFGTAMKNMFIQVGDAAAQNAAKNLATMATQSLMGNSLRSTEIRKDAGAGAAAAYKAIVGIPYVGPFLAPAAAAVAYAGILAFDSAEQGYDVPRGMNPMTQLHEREMVLPRQHADVIRGLADQSPGGGGAGGGGGGGGSTVHMHGGPNFTRDQLVGMLKDLGHRFVLS